MTRLPTTLALLAIGAMAVGGCGGGGEPAATTGARTPTSATVEPADATPPTGAAPGDATVSMRNIKFTPATAKVTVGETVKWNNDDGVAHTATAPGGQFDSGTLEPGATYQYKPARAGTIRYLCTIHGAQQSGTIQVEG